ncbi:amidohydrolase [Chloroflexota bacterium]
MNPSADLLLQNARVITLDPAKPRAEAIAIKDTRVLDVGSQKDLEPLKGAVTKVLDCQGKAVLPGFNDAHCHPIALAASLLSVDCSPSYVRSIGELQDKIRHRASLTPPGHWIRAVAYNEFYLAEKRHPNRRDLDEAAPDHPVRLTHRSGHACVLNSPALNLLGIAYDTPEPPGALIERDLETGEPNGLLFEMNSYIEGRMPPLSEEDIQRGIMLANEQFLSHGITSLQDATWTDTPRRWQLLRRFQEQGGLSPHVSLMIGEGEIEEFAERGLTTGSDLGSRLSLGAVKIVLHSATGSLNPSQEELNRLAHKAHRAGFQLAIHAIEENEVEAAVAALEYALSRDPRPDHRHRVEHCSVCPPHLQERLRNAQAMVVTQPSFLYYSGERYLATVPAKDLDWLYPISSLMRKGIKVAAASDAPVVPVNPLRGIYAAVTRTAETGQTLLPQEGVSKLKALEMHTKEPAYASFEEGVKGCIAPNMLADLIVLNRDPTEIETEDMGNVEIATTIVDGKVVWQK